MVRMTGPLCGDPAPTGSRGSVLLEALLVGVILSLVATGLLASILGADRSARQAGQYAAASALGESIIEEMRLLPAGDERLEAGEWEWCPPDCPEGIDRAQVAVEAPADLPETARRVTVSLFRTGAERPVQVVSYVRH